MTVVANEMLPPYVCGSQLYVSGLTLAVVADQDPYAGLAPDHVRKSSVDVHLYEHDVGCQLAIALPVVLDLLDHQGKEHRDQQPSNHERHFLKLDRKSVV